MCKSMKVEETRIDAREMHKREKGAVRRFNVRAVWTERRVREPMSPLPLRVLSSSSGDMAGDNPGDRFHDSRSGES
jgi:hypothetical protein